MMYYLRCAFNTVAVLLLSAVSFAQKSERVKVINKPDEKKADIFPALFMQVYCPETQCQ